MNKTNKKLTQKYARACRVGHPIVHHVEREGERVAVPKVLYGTHIIKGNTVMFNHFLTRSKAMLYASMYRRLYGLTPEHQTHINVDTLCREYEDTFPKGGNR